MALFRVDFSGRGELADRQQKLAQMLSRLQKISEGRLIESNNDTAGPGLVSLYVRVHGFLSSLLGY